MDWCVTKRMEKKYNPTSGVVSLPVVMVVVVQSKIVFLKLTDDFESNRIFGFRTIGEIFVTFSYIFFNFRIF